MAGKVALEADWLLAEAGDELVQAIHDGLVRRAARDDLDRRHEMRRIGEMGHRDAAFVAAFLGNDIDRHARCGAGEDRFGPRGLLDRSEYRLLDGSILGHRLEGEIDTGRRAGQIGAEAQAVAPSGTRRRQ